MIWTVVDGPSMNPGRSDIDGPAQRRAGGRVTHLIGLACRRVEIDAKPAVVGIAPLDFSPQRRPFDDGAP